MTVQISQDEMNILNLNGISVEDAKANVDYLRATGLNDEEIRNQFSNTIEELRPLTKQGANDTGNIQTWKDKGPITPFEEGKRKSVLFDGTYSNVDKNANLSKFGMLLSNSKINEDVDKKISEAEQRKQERNTRVNEGTASFLDRAGAFVDRIAEGQVQSAMDSPDDFVVQMSGVNKTDNSDKSQKIGFKESLADSFSSGGWLPFVGGFITGSEAKKERDILERVRNGESVRPDELNYLNYKIEQQQEENVRGYTLGGNIARDFLPSLIRFGTEMATGGWVLDSLGLGSKVAEGASVSSKVGTALADMLKTGTVNTVLPTGWNDIYETYQNRMLNNTFGLTDKGETIFREAEEKPATALMKSIGQAFIMFASEASGELLSLPIKGVGAATSKYIGSPIGEYLASNKQLVNLYKKAVPAFSKLYEKMNKLPIKGENVDWLKSKVHYDGFLEELGEEVVEDVLNLTIGTDNQKRSLENYAKAIFKSPDEWAVLAGAIALQGGTLSAASHILGNHMERNGATDDEIVETLNNLSENDKEKAVEKLIQNGEINIDTTSEQRIEQSIDNLTTTLFDTGKYSNRDQAEKVARLGVNMLGSIADKTGIDIEDLINEDMPNIEQDNRETFVDDNGVVHSGITYNEQEQTLGNRYNELIDEISNLPDDYSDEEHINKMVSEVDLLEKIQSDENLSIDDMELANDLIEDYENNGNKRLANQLRQKLENSNVEQHGKNETQHFQRATTAGATTKDEKLNAIKEWKEKGTDSKYFKKWFGDSKVVDESGKPLVVYHSSNNLFKIFDNNKIKNGKGFWFSSDKDYSKEHGNNLYPVYLKVEKPFDIDKQDDNIGKYTDNPEDLINNKQVQEKLQKDGYDGIVFDKNEGRTYIVFNPEQIKSVDNRGTFDENNPNIYFQRANRDNVNSNIEENFNDTTENITSYIKGDIQNILDENNVDESEFKLEDIKIYGSYSTSTNKKGSDLDFLVQYSGTMKEDVAFNMFADNNLSITDKNGNDVKIDLNPINSSLSGTIDEHLNYYDNLEPAPKTYFQRATNNNNNVVDLTNDFEKTPSIDEVKAYINEIVENGTKFATLSPNWFVDIKGGRRTTNKILNAGNYKNLEKMGRKRHNKYIMSLEKLLANAEYVGEKENTKKDKKPNVEKYHYFKTDVKIGNKIYQLIFDTEEYKNDNKKSTSVGYAKRNLNETEADTNIINDNVKNFKGGTEEYKNSPQAAQHDNRILNPQSEDNNIINDNAEKNNPKTVHLYNIKEIKKTKMYFQSAYHGSPHKFDEFSLDAIGTGEGNQAHGWGLYFAGNKDVSEKYRKTLSNDDYSNEKYFYHGEEITDRNKKAILSTIVENGKYKVISTREKNIEKYKYSQEEYKQKNEELDWIKSLDENKIEKKTDKGQLFEVDIPEDDVLLDEDKTFAEQPKKVQEGINKIFEEEKPSIIISDKIKWFDSMLDKLEQEAIQDGGYTTQANYSRDLFESKISNLETLLSKLNNYSNLKGEDIYGILSTVFEDDRDASIKLNEYGIKGIKYNGHQDGECYVIFDDKAVQVLKKYYQKQRKMFIDKDRADEIANRLVQVKGSFIPAENLVKLFKDADESTIVHEFAHWWLEKLVKHSEGNEELQEDLKEIRKFVKNNGEEFTDEQHERFARGFEAYMRTGSAKTNRLKKLFEDFKNALLSLYDGIKSLGFEESEIPEINNLFDRLLTTENQRIQAAVFDRCNTIQSQIEEIRTNQEKELSEIDEIEQNNIERDLQNNRRKQQVEEYIRLAEKAASRVPKSVKEYQQRYKNATFEILEKATGYKRQFIANSRNWETVQEKIVNIDDPFSGGDGMSANWYEFYHDDTGVSYDNDEMGDFDLAQKAFDVMTNGTYLPPENYEGEQAIGKFFGMFDYLSGKVLSLRGENKDNAFEALCSLFKNIPAMPDEAMQEITQKLSDISDTFIDQKAQENPAKRSVPNVSLATQLRTYVTSKLHNMKIFDPISKRNIRLSEVNKLYTMLKYASDVLSTKEIIRQINNHAIKQLENRQKFILHKEIQKQVKINSKLLKVGSLKQGKFDWKTNTVFAELQQMNMLKKDEARAEYLRLIDADSAVIGEERDNINQDVTTDIKAPTDFQGILKVKFLEYKSNNPKDLNLSATRSLLEDILQLKFEGRRAKNEQDLKKALTRYDYKNNLIEIMDKHRDNKVAKYLARWTAGDTIWTSEGTLANWESLLTGIFDKATAEKYSLLKAESDVEVYAHRKALGFYKKAMDIYHLNRSNEGLKNKFLNVWDRALDFDNIQPLVDLFRKYDETNYPFKQVTWNKDTGEFVETTIELSHSQLITLYAWSLNPNLKERLITQFVGEDVPKGAEKLDELMFSKLSEQDKLFAWAMVDTCDTMYEDTNEVFIRTTGLSLPKVDNYIPSKTERIGSDLDMMHETMLRSTNPSFIKQRKNCSRIKMDPLSPLEIILPHINKTARYVVMSEKVNFYNRIFQSPDIKAKMVEIYGKKSGEKIHRILLNQLATSTYDNYAKSITVGKNLIDNVASNYITSKIGGNLKVMFSQLTSMVNYCENMPFGMWNKGFIEALAHPKKTVDFMFKNCEYLQARLAGNSQNEIISMLTNESDKFRALRNFCTSNTKYGDIIAIMFGGKPYVDYLMSQGMSQEEAFTKFTEDTLRSQQSGHSSATSAWQKKQAQNAITRMIFAFNNTNFQYERKFVDSMVNLTKGDISKEEFMKSFLVYKVFNPILFTSFLSDLSLLILLQNMFGGGDDDPLASFGSDIINAICMSNWKAYGFLGIIANSIVAAISAKATGGMYFDEKLPLISDFETSANKLLSGKELELGDYVEMIAGAGDYGTGIAASRLYNGVGGVGDILEGNVGTGLLRLGGYGKYRANIAATGQPPERKKK